jgi:superfamily II DNA or RNA helicase
VESLAEFFDVLRDACPKAVWSRGVETHRTATIVGVLAADDEIELTVSPLLKPAAWTVTFFIDDEDWVCNCTPREILCEHIVAAALALQAARRDGRELPVPEGGVARLGYRLQRGTGGLSLARVLVTDDGERPLRGSLAAVALRAGDGPPIVSSPHDLNVGRLMGVLRKGWIPASEMPTLLEALKACDDVRLDGQSVKIEMRAVGLRVRVDDGEGGVRLTVEPDPIITQTFSNGVALCGDTLQPVKPESGLTARELEEFTDGKVFGPDTLADLVTEILPELQRRTHVVIKTKRLPRTTVDEVGVMLDVSREGDVLIVLPALVYGDPPIARVDGDRLTVLGDFVPERDKAAERQARRRLQHQLKLSCGHAMRFEGEEAIEFAARLQEWEGGSVRGAAHETFYLAPPLEAMLDIDDDTFDLAFFADDPEDDDLHRRADSAGVLDAWQRGLTVAPLSDGGFAPLPMDWMNRFGPILMDLLAARQDDGSTPRCMVPDLARLCDALDQPRPQASGMVERLLDGFDGIPPATLPADLKAELRDYQTLGVNWLALMRDTGFGAMLADDMGLGKTLQALCVVQGRTIVVAPTSVLHNWRLEIEKFRPDLTVSVYHGTKRSLDSAADVTLTTYAILRLDVDELAGVQWDTLVLDEAQAVKNPDSQVARAAYRLNGTFRMTLTGTPIENRLDELWSQFHFLNRGLLGSRRDFQKRYAGPVEAGKSEVSERLRQRLRPFLLRRLKRDVAKELPPRTSVVRRCELNEVERKTYDAIAAATRNEVVSRLKAGGSVLHALEALLRLRQAACHRALVPGQTADASSKLDLLATLLDGLIGGGHKVLVFSQWTSLLDLVQPYLQRAEIEFTRLDGSTRDRQGVVDTFQSDDGPPVLLASLKAGGIGLNLTAADHVFLLDPWWNPAAEDQATDRAHRIGQVRPVVVHRLVAADTVEERILVLQERKRALADSVLDGAAAAARLTRDDLVNLLA